VFDCDTPEALPYCAAALMESGAAATKARRNASDREELRLAALKKFFERAPGHTFPIAGLEYPASLPLVHRISRGCDPGRFGKTL
jgi:hypothetical protein